MSLRDKLIQNVFELHGSFDELDRYSIFDGVSENMAYEALGYKGQYGMSASEVFNLIVEYNKDNNEAINKVKELGMNVKKYQKIDFTIFDDPLVTYMLISKDMVSFRGNKMKLCDVVKVLTIDRANARSMINTLLEENDIFKFVHTNCSDVMITDGVIYSNRKLTKTQVKNIIKNALIVACGLIIKLPNKFFASGITYLSNNDNSMYRYLIELATVNDVTLAQLLQYVGVNIPDFVIQYIETGNLIYSVNGKKYLLNMDYNGVNPYVKL